MDVFLQLLLAGLVIGSIYTLVALGYVLIFGVMRILNFAQGDILMMGAFAGFIALNMWHLPLIVTLLVVVVAMTLLAIVTERFVLRHFDTSSPMGAVLATFGLGLALENLMVKFFGPDQIAFRSPWPPTFYTVGGMQFSDYQVIILVGAALLIIGLKLLLEHTRLGQAMLATAEDGEVASFLGVNTRMVVIFSLVIASVLAGIAGLAIGLYYTVISAFMGINYGIKGMVILVLGGSTSLVGALVGGLLMGVAETMTVGYISSSYRDAVAFAFLVIVLIIRPSGLFGTHQTEKV